MTIMSSIDNNLLLNLLLWPAPCLVRQIACDLEGIAIIKPPNRQDKAVGAPEQYVDGC